MVSNEILEQTKKMRGANTWLKGFVVFPKLLQRAGLSVEDYTNKSSEDAQIIAQNLMGGQAQTSLLGTPQTYDLRRGNTKGNKKTLLGQ